MNDRHNTIIKNCGAFFVVSISSKECEILSTFWSQEEAEDYGQTQPL